jgi:hypothetical protein
MERKMVELPFTYLIQQTTMSRLAVKGKGEGGILGYHKALED